MLSKLRLSNFRCFEKIDCLLDNETTILIGDNAQGKTTILESVCLLIRLQSPRTSKIRDQVKIGQSNLAVEGLLSDKKVILQDPPRRREPHPRGQRSGPERRHRMQGGRGADRSAVGGRLDRVPQGSTARDHHRQLI